MRAIVVVVGAALAATAWAGEQAVTFSRDVHPVLSNKCFGCHGPSAPDRKGNLRLDVPDGDSGALTPRADGYIIKPGNPEESELWRRITATDPDDLMPPENSHKPPLTPAELAAVKQWITDGAVYEPFWSFIPPRHAPEPELQDPSWPANFIDRRVLARLEKAGLTPSPEADKRTLLRRVTFDLTGLPPTLEEIERFLADESPDAYARAVDELLARPAYGEHMTRYWADLVRLADTNGMHKDFHREFSTYRDWLIRSFNDNLPYDEFLKYQLAGDLYDNPTQDQLVASGFNRLHLIIDVGTALPEESLFKNVLDRVSAFGTTFLGLTVQCAQCHDHKYDPITQKEFFEIFAFFNNFAGEPETTNRPARGLQPPFIYLTNPEQEEQIAASEADQARIENLIARIRERQPAALAPENAQPAPAPWIWVNAPDWTGQVAFRTLLHLDAAPDSALLRFTGMTSATVEINGSDAGTARGVEGGVAADIAGLLLPGENLITARADGNAGFAFLLEYAIAGEKHVFTSSANWEARPEGEADWKPAIEVFTPEHEMVWAKNAAPENIRRLRRQAGEIERARQAYLDQIPAAMVMREREPAREATMFARGAYDAPGEPVERNTPAFLPAMAPVDRPYTRLDLAEWLVAPDHPLTARVQVNRLWQQFFGIGLVKTSEDLGVQGERPSHPDLLDDLALRFIESGWDTKALVRAIVLSNTYRQRSDAPPEAFQRDPENRLLARGARYRMDAEMIRDQILLVSGQLNPAIYGPSVKPPQPPGLWEMVSMAEPFTYVADTDERIYRRSLYTYWRRGMPPPQMTIMNAPSREFCVARRERTNTPLQALLMMNEQEYMKAARACVQSTLEPGMPPEEGLRRIYEKITSQEPSPARTQFMLQTLEEFRDIYRRDPENATQLAPELAEAGHEERADLAAWTMMAHSMLNLELAKVRR
ncbi:MAG: PSD1 domain-containing protein [Candidatus Hydrogenedentes bacterium]|nr:PSD1 domain-containing protein [Candidatus Hydrogenedentota bacterium]